MACSVTITPNRKQPAASVKTPKSLEVVVLECGTFLQGRHTHARPSVGRSGDFFLLGIFCVPMVGQLGTAGLGVGCFFIRAFHSRH